LELIDFINILGAHFAPLFWPQKLQSHVFDLKFFGGKISAKKCSYNVDEIDTFRQIHQHFTKSLYANIIAPKNYKGQTVTREKLQKV